LLLDIFCEAQESASYYGRDYRKLGSRVARNNIMFHGAKRMAFANPDIYLYHVLEWHVFDLRRGSSCSRLNETFPYYDEDITVKHLESLMAAFIFFGLGLIGLAILALSALYATSHSQAIGKGIIGSIFLGLQSLLLMFVSGVGSATSGSQTGYCVSSLIVVFFVLCIAAYFWFVPTIAQRRNRK
jgi:hypothetical protein